MFLCLTLVLEVVHSPFPFMKLPAEIRNTIYRLAATSYHFGRLDKYILRKWRGIFVFVNVFGRRTDQDTIVQPGLVFCSKQTRAEGLPIFFHYHHFHFESWNMPWLFCGTLVWLDKIGTLNGLSIRHITFANNIWSEDVPAMKKIHERLSEDVTVQYLMVNRNEPAIEERFRTHGAAKVPVLGDGTAQIFRHTLTFPPGPW